MDYFTPLAFARGTADLKQLLHNFDGLTELVGEQ